MLGRPEPRWGMWQIPESELLILGDVAGKDVLEYGCGAAQWSILLAQQGARPVGHGQLRAPARARRAAAEEAGVDFPLVHASAGEAPFADASFDIVFCDHGAMTFQDPDITVPEVARLLRPGGLLAFSHTTPLSQLCWRRGPKRSSTPSCTGPTSGWGGSSGRTSRTSRSRSRARRASWIRLFRAHGLHGRALHEVQPPEGAVSTYRDEETEWARQWPMEQIWAVRKWS